MKRLIVPALFVALLSFAPNTFAELCKDCQGKMVVMAMGKCKACGKTMSSMSYKYCGACAKKKGACALCGKNVVGGDTKDTDLVTGNNACAVDLYNQLKSKNGNVFISPYSISSALAMTYAGAKGNTATEMAKALHFGTPQEKLPSSFKTLNAQLMANAKKSGQKLAIANGLCLTGGDVSKEFKTVLKDNYSAELFTGNLETINDWVKKKTEDKIPKILDKLDPNSVCVLLNAVYFKGNWASQFDKKRTRNAPFNVSASKKVTVPMMYQKASFKILTKDGFQIVSIPYEGEQLSMVVLLPQAVDGLAKVEAQVTSLKLKRWMAELDRCRARKIMLFLPKFKLETNYDLVPTCKAMGIADAFDAARADFSGMGWPKGLLYISQVKHKAFVEVNEEGTEAAAATAVEMATKNGHRYPIFRADHPFLFFIRDNQTGSILFIGRIVDPTK